MVRVAAIEVWTLLEVVYVSILAGVGVTALFSFVILAGARSADAQRKGDRSHALLYTALAALCLLAFLAVLVIGVQIMLSKD
jgi:hypothetical protein